MTVNDLIKLLDTEGNRYGGATGKPRELNLTVGGRFLGTVDNAKLDGYGDGLITDVTLEVETSKYNYTNADRIRSMSDEELAEFICGLNDNCLAGIGLCDCSSESKKSCEEICMKKTIEYLQSKSESE